MKGAVQNIFNRGIDLPQFKQAAKEAAKLAKYKQKMNDMFSTYYGVPLPLPDEMIEDYFKANTKIREVVTEIGNDRGFTKR